MNIEYTLYNTFNNVIKSMRMIGDSNPKLLKQILYYIILNDLKEWAIDKKDTCTIAYLDKYLNFMLQLDCEFECINKYNNFFIGLGIPHNYLESLRMFDNPNVIVLENTIDTITDSTINPDCKSEVILYPGYIREIEIIVGLNGEPIIQEFDKLTTCEKMSIFINKETGKAYYYDEHGNQRPVQAEIATDSTIQWDQIDENGRPIIYQGLQLQSENGINLSLTTDNNPSVDFPIVSSEDINNLE